MSDSHKTINVFISFVILFFFLLFMNGCELWDNEKFEDYHPWWLQSDQQSDSEVNDVLVIQEN